MRRLLEKIPLVVCGSLLCVVSHAATGVDVAVAANFTLPMQQIARQFQAETGYQARLAFGSSGNLYAQIVNGAPFQVFLSADEVKPRKLEQAGLAVAGSRFTYAVGALVLWSSRPGFVDAGGEILSRGTFNKLSLANPRLAPYGRAAVQTLESMKLDKKLQAKFILGENISQTYQFVMSGNADLGFVAQSQVYKDGKLQAGSGWVVPAGLYRPIRQDAVLLANRKDNPAALSLMRFSRGAKTGAMIKAFGYHT